jgi:hypothetical protein
LHLAAREEITPILVFLLPLPVRPLFSLMPPRAEDVTMEKPTFSDLR